MERPIVYLQNLNKHDFLLGDNNHELQHIATELYLELKQILATGKTPKIILSQPEPVQFIASFIAACAANCHIFLCNPNWGKQEWQQVIDLVQPDIIWGKVEHSPSLLLPTPDSRLPSPYTLIMIPTGGSSGQIKFAIHTWETLTASVQGFTEYFQIQQVNSCCVLPLYHVSGLMQFMRSFTTGGKLAIAPFKELISGQIFPINPADFFISLVPTQLQIFLQNPQLTAWLAQFTTVLLGGGPAWPELLEKAKFHRIRLAPTYGMTETASQIATLKPDDFFSGITSSGQILPHAQVTIRNQNGEILQPNQIGNITIQAQSLTLGYYPHTWENQNYLQIDDLGFLDTQGYLNIIGRSSDKIITGGENIYPAEIESAIRATQMVNDVSIIGLPDQHWGQVVTAIYIPKNSNISSCKIQTHLTHQLSKFKIPKYWIPLPTLPRNAQGKINRQQLQQIALKFLQNLS
ncbi:MULTISPECIES: 2-succinylbenzoate--CoA ligase [unclassified Anabaena]|uniref:2-succinylbenzoate--CoA ligase n=1 Tax=unclassified Anabaena TaxID=2619674 RepID=UPI0039C72E62